MSGISLASALSDRLFLPDRVVLVLPGDGTWAVRSLPRTTMQAAARRPAGVRARYCASYLPGKHADCRSPAAPAIQAQHATLRAAGCERIFTDTASGKLPERPELTACLDYLRLGDTLVCTKLDRLGRSVKHLVDLVAPS